jgi:hypothetical protein
MNIKTSVALFSLILMLFVSTHLDAQNRKRSQSDDDYTKFLVGIAPISPFSKIGKINLHGEVAYSHNKSVSLLVGIPKETKLPKFIRNWVEVSPDSLQGTTKSQSYKSFGWSLENRFYLGADVARGFYIAPYLRYNKWTIAQVVEGESGFATTIKGTIGGFGLGAALGAQFKLGGPITMDITFAGGDFKWLKGTASYSSNDPNNDIVAFRNKVTDVVKDIPFIGKRITDKIDANEVKISSPRIIAPGFRANLTINYAF